MLVATVLVCLLLPIQVVATDYTWDGVAWTPSAPPATAPAAGRPHTVTFQADYTNATLNLTEYAGIVVGPGVTATIGNIFLGFIGVDLTISGTGTLNTGDIDMTGLGGDLIVAAGTTLNVNGDVNGLLGVGSDLTVNGTINVTGDLIGFGGVVGLPISGSGTINGNCTPPCDCPTAPCPTVTPLPVQLVVFTGEQQGGNVYLRWTTASELNNSHFEVEYGRDGVGFAVLGRVEGSGTTQTTRDYSYVHMSSPGGTLYYRLKQVDFDGAYTYSPVLELDGPGKDAASWSVRPNPVTGPLEIVLMTPELTAQTLHRAEMLDVGGVVVCKVSGNLGVVTAVLSSQLQQQKSGVYLLRLTAGDKQQLVRILRP